MLSTRSRYSIIALCDIALRSGNRSGRPVPVSLVDVAETHDLSLCYLEQLAVRWRRAGFVKGVRGPQGGYVLRREPSAITVADIARAMDEAACAGDCDHADTARRSGCPAQRVLDVVTDQVIHALAAISLADLGSPAEREEAEDETPSLSPSRGAGTGHPVV